jgi:hypothetical protein
MQTNYMGTKSKQVGRPTTMTKATVQKLEAALQDGFSIETACHVSGISRSTYYDHLDRSPDFTYKMELAKDWVTQRAKQVVAQAIDKGDLKAAQWYLERKCRAEFAANPPPIPVSRQNLFGDGSNEKLIKVIADSMAAISEYPEPEVALAEA